MLSLSINLGQPLHKHPVPLTFDEEKVPFKSSTEYALGFRLSDRKKVLTIISNGNADDPLQHHRHRQVDAKIASFFSYHVQNILLSNYFNN